MTYTQTQAHRRTGTQAQTQSEGEGDRAGTQTDGTCRFRENVQDTESHTQSHRQAAARQAEHTVHGPVHTAAIYVCVCMCSVRINTWLQPFQRCGRDRNIIRAARPAPCAVTLIRWVGAVIIF